MAKDQFRGEDLARQAAIDDAGDKKLVGSIISIESEHEHLATYLFQSFLPGYKGWRWAVTLTRIEKLDEDRSVKDHLISISAILKSLGEQNIDKISEIQNNLTLELRAISKQLSKTEKSKNKFNDE